MSHDMMKIKLNGAELEVKQDITLTVLLSQQALDKGRFVVVVNDEVIPKSHYDTATLNAQDALDVITPITGG